MNQGQLRELYEKLYFHEVESRDKINSRLQIPLTLIVTIVGATAFLLQNYPYEEFHLATWHAMFAFFMLASLIALGFAIFFFSRSWWNNAYTFLPVAADTIAYEKTLQETYGEFAEKNELVAKYLEAYITNAYVEYSSENAKVNDVRSAYIHRANASIILTAVLLFCAFLAFYFGGLDRSRVSKPQEVSISKPVEVRIQR